MLQGKRIVVGITGSIAAYKAAMLVRKLVKAGAEVRVVMTDSACKFITPLTMATLSQGEVVLDMFPGNASKGTWHIHLARWADVMIIAPASANTIAKLAHGFADNALSTLALAIRCPMIVAPAMDTDMFVHEATKTNIELLKQRGVHFIDPEVGELASGLTGHGRLPDTSVLFNFISETLRAKTDKFRSMNVLITAGPTYESIDPVRFIGNRSSGKMGFALAEAAARMGARVTLVSGPVNLPTPRGITRIDVESAIDMHEAVLGRALNSKLIIMAAAVGDFRSTEQSSQKLKKDSFGENGFTLSLEPNPDILLQLGEQKHDQILIGFALETENDIANATNKLKRKNADMIVLNNPNNEGAAFGAETNVVTLLFADGRTVVLPKMSKSAVAEHLLHIIEENFFSSHA